MTYREIIRGDRRGPLASGMRGGLAIASRIYGAAVSSRGRRYDRGASPSIRCGIPVISVGNLTTGGTGKTPIVCLICRWFRQAGVRVSIVSRGYGRGKEDSNDEAKELHWRLPDVPHVQDPDRVAAAEIARDELAAEVIVMDDGFQHRRLHRDLDIVVIDASCPFGYGYLLPRGLLREPLSGLARADLVIVTRCADAKQEDLDQIERQIRQQNDRVAILRSDHRPSGLLEHPERILPIDWLGGRAVAVVSAIGNPQAFEQTVRRCGANVVATRRLADHDAYDVETVDKLREWLRSLDESIDAVVCTHKDLVKLRCDRLEGSPLLALLIDLDILGDRTPLDNALERIAQETRRDHPNRSS